MVDKICSAVRKGIYMMCCVLLACWVPIVSDVVVSCYILKHIPSWGGNLALICMVWLCLLSSAVAISRDLHLKVTLIDSFISDRARTTMNLSDLLLVFIFGAVMAFSSCGLLGLTPGNIMSDTGLPSSVLYAVVPVSGLALIVATIDRRGTLLCHLKQ